MLELAEIKMMILNEFVTMIIGDYMNTSKEKLKVLLKKKKITNFDSEMYTILVDSLHQMIGLRYDIEKIYDMAEQILNKLQVSEDITVTAIEKCLKSILPSTAEGLGEKFCEIVCEKICKKENAELYNRISLSIEMKQNVKMVEIEMLVGKLREELLLKQFQERSNYGKIICADLPYVKIYHGKRQKEIEQINEYLKRESVIFLEGVGGIGKSVLSLLYGKSMLEKGYKVYYVSFTKSFFYTINNITISEYDVLDEDRKVKTAEVIFREKLLLISSQCDENTIIILDNVYNSEKTFEELIVEDDEDAFECFLRLPAKKIISTRYCIEEYPKMIVKSLKTDELLKIMDTYYPYNAEATRNIRLKIIEKLFYHTLTVELAARTLKALRGTKTPEELLEELKNNSSEEDKLPNVYTSYDCQSKPIYNHLYQLFRVSGLTQKEQILLMQLSMISDRGIYSKLFMNCCYEGKESINVTNELIDKGWVQCDDNTHTLYVHPLIRLVVNRKYKNNVYMKTEFLLKLVKSDGLEFEEISQVYGIIGEAYKNQFAIPFEASLFLLEAVLRVMKEKNDYLETIPEINEHYQKCINMNDLAFMIAEDSGIVEKNKIALLKKESIEMYQDLCERSIKDLNTKIEVEKKRKEYERVKEEGERLEKEYEESKKKTKQVCDEVVKVISNLFRKYNIPYLDECVEALNDGLCEEKSVNTDLL